MRSNSHRVGKVSAFLAILLWSASREAPAQIPLGELQRPDVGVRDFFGGAMSCDDVTLAASVERCIDVFQVVEDGARWVQRLGADDVDNEHVEAYYPNNPAVHGDWLAVADDHAILNGFGSTGAVHMFRRDREHWEYAQSLTPPLPVVGGEFGSCLDFDGRTLAVGSPEEDSDRGALHLYEFVNGTWTLVQTIAGLLPYSEFGSGVSVDGRWLLVGAAHEGLFTSLHAYVHFFERAAQDPLAPWEWRQSFVGPGEYSSWFGFDMDLNVPHAVAADSGDGNVGFSPAQGIVTFELASDGVWEETGLILEPEPGLSGPNPLGFGGALCLRGDELLVGSRHYYDLQDSGAVYRYRHGESGWQFAGRIVPSTPKTEGGFGTAIVRGPGLIFASAPWKYPTCGTIPWFEIYACVAKGAVQAFRAAEDATQFCSCPSAAPCGNSDHHGGCANLKGFGGVLASGGSGSVGLNDLELMSWSLPGGAPVLLLAGDESPSKPFGDGRLCVADPFVRLAFPPADLRGQSSFGPGLIGLATSVGYQALPGSSGTFQVLYRDPPGPCGSGVNLTNAVRVDFKP